jgi:hypothetical protein
MRHTPGRTGRLGLVGVLATTVLPLSACQLQASCSDIEYSIAANAHGAANARAALDAFLAGADAKDFPTAGWTGPSAAGLFSAGAASVTVTQLGGAAGWFVTSAKTC